MKQILGYWREALREHWNLPYFFVMGLFFAVAFILNYGFGLDDRVMALRPLGPIHTAACFVYYGIPYTFAYVAYAVLYRRRDLLTRWEVWTLGAIAVLGYAIHAGSWGVSTLGRALPLDLQMYASRSAANLLPALGGITVLLGFWLTLDRKVQGLYGLTAPRVKLAPYWGYLVLGLPFVVAASFGADFLSTYPRLPDPGPLAAYGLPSWLAVLLFELCYGIAFVFTELFFRGFLVVGMGRRMGSAAIFPMVAFYCFIHFGKPMFEAMASIVGGWALGVIAYRTKSIRGGVLFHLGVAYSLELCAFLQKSFSHAP